jgi:hypothetical protein
MDRDREHTLIPSDRRASGATSTCFKRNKTSTATPSNGKNKSGVELDFDRARSVVIKVESLSPAWNRSSKCKMITKLTHTERKARLTRTIAPCFNDGLALTEPFIMSNSVASVPTSTRQGCVAGKSGLALRQMEYNPQDQLRRTNRSDGAYELDKGNNVMG